MILHQFLDNLYHLSFLNIRKFQNRKKHLRGFQQCTDNCVGPCNWEPQGQTNTPPVSPTVRSMVNSSISSLAIARCKRKIRPLLVVTVAEGWWTSLLWLSNCAVFVSKTVGGFLGDWMQEYFRFAGGRDSALVSAVNGRFCWSGILLFPRR